MLCPGVGTAREHLCGQCALEADDPRGAIPGSTCLTFAPFEGADTSFDISGMEANADTIDFVADSQFVTPEDIERLYQAAQGEDSSFVKITMLRESRISPGNQNQCLGSASCTYYFFYQRFKAVNMGWTIINVLPEEDLLKATGVEMDTSSLDDHTVE